MTESHHELRCCGGPLASSTSVVGLNNDEYPSAAKPLGLVAEANPRYENHVVHSIGLPNPHRDPPPKIGVVAARGSPTARTKR